ncbi:MAG TPA: discoidin domain-containing protein, partial [Acidimicrobiales bacterium]|nr:discoidin domain-containing protein [Acidimicrobiales bacterium]
RHTRGYTEPAGSEPLEVDATDNRLPVFPDAGEDAMTMAHELGGVVARATRYGNPITFTSEERPALAVDGDIDTAWRTSAFADARGERIELELAEPVTTDHVTLTQPINGARNRFITGARLRFDGGSPIDVPLGTESRDAPGQRIGFEERTFDTLSIEILADTAGVIPGFGGLSSVGFSEVTIGDEPPLQRETIALPTDLLSATGTAAIDHPLTILLTRQRHDPSDTTRTDEEQHVARELTLPSGREFTLSGDVRLFRRHPPYVLDEALGRPHDGSVTWARASSQLNGAVHTASAAFDGDPATAWTTQRDTPERQWVEVNLTEEVTVDTVPLTLVADGLHSVPTEVEVSVDGTRLGRVPLEPVVDGDHQNATAEVEAVLPEEVTGSSFRFRLTGIRAVTTNDWVSDREVDQAVAIAEIGLPGPKVPELPERFDTGCRDDLLTIDGESQPVRATGPMSTVLAGDPVPLATCSGDPVVLGGGEHEIDTAPGDSSGLDIDQLVLRSDAGGQASPAEDATLVE